MEIPQTKLHGVKYALFVKWTRISTEKLMHRDEKPRGRWSEEVCVCVSGRQGGRLRELATMKAKVNSIVGYSVRRMGMWPINMFGRDEPIMSPKSLFRVQYLILQCISIFGMVAFFVSPFDQFV